MRCGSSPRIARPDLLFEYAASARERGLKAIIAGAGGAAHLPGMTAAKTIGAGARRARANQDAWAASIRCSRSRRCRAAFPVATFAIGAAGARNAALFAAAMLANEFAEVRLALDAFRCRADGGGAQQTRSAPALKLLERRHRRCGTTGAHDGARRVSARDPLLLPRQQRDAPAAQVAPILTGALEDRRAARRSSPRRAMCSRSIGRTSRARRSLRSKSLTKFARRAPRWRSPRIACTRRRCSRASRSRSPNMPRSIRGRISREAARKLGTPGVLKTRRMGYDGKGQFVIERPRGSSTLHGISIGVAGTDLREVPDASRARCPSSPPAPPPATSSYYPLVGQHPRRAASFATASRRTRTARSSARRRIYMKRVLTALEYIGRARHRVLRGQGPADRQRDGAAGSQLRPLDHRGLRHQPIREPSARHLRLAARQHPAPGTHRHDQFSRANAQTGSGCWASRGWPFTIMEKSRGRAGNWAIAPSSGPRPGIATGRSRMH